MFQITYSFYSHIFERIIGKDRNRSTTQKCVYRKKESKNTIDK